VNPYEHLKGTHEYAKLKKVTFTKILVTQGCRTVLELILNEVEENERKKFSDLNDKYGILEALEIAILYDHQRQLWNRKNPILHGHLKEIKSRNHYAHIDSANIIGKLHTRTLRSFFNN
jgi:hypothetical protein